MQVSDTGVGIAEEDQQTIFEKFRQGRTGAPSGDAMTREYSGTGLGLSIVKELCRLLGGEVSVRERAGQGQHLHRPAALDAAGAAAAGFAADRGLRRLRQAPLRVRPRPRPPAPTARGRRRHEG